MQTLPQLLPPAEMGTAQQEDAMSVFRRPSLLPTREELAAKAYDTIQFWMESGHSQLLNREQALQIAAWGLKIAGEGELQHQVLAELVELPENYG